MPDPMFITNYKDFRYIFPTHHIFARATPNAQQLTRQKRQESSMLDKWMERC
jgi:hypothetical protein